MITSTPTDGRKKVVAAGQNAPVDVELYSNLIVNLFFVGQAGSGEWTLVDAGLPFSAPSILSAAARRFGKGSKPNAIVLTHGHFDHVGSLVSLAETWDVPIWAHELEAPYLTGRSAYPPPDPTVGGGMMSRLSPLYPRGPIDVSRWLRILPSDGMVPPMSDWKWIHTPGHTAGHISLFREKDRTLIAGDAFVTTRQESAMDALLKPYVIHGPPMYFTSDWEASRRSVEKLAALQPAAAFTGHGEPVFGEQLRRDLDRLARRFNELAKPNHGRYVNSPAITDERGVVHVPPPVPDPVPKILAALAVAGVVAYLVARRRDDHSA